MNNLISLILKLFRDSPSKLWREFGKEVNSVYKKEYRDLIELFSKISNYRK